MHTTAPHSRQHHAIVLAGGTGSRLWPLSRAMKPKQLLRLNDRDSLLQQTVKRIMRLVDVEHIVTVTNEDYRFEILDQLNAVHPALGNNALFEPVRRNTLAAIAWAAMRIKKQDPDAIISVFSSDHAINDEDAFTAAWYSAEQTALHDYMTLFGMKPTYSATGYGYIQAGTEIPIPRTARSDCIRPYQVSRFVEKPDLETAKSYLEQEGFYWNGGIFVFPVSLFWQQLGRHYPEMLEVMDKLEMSAYATVNADIYASLPDTSIDYGLLEKADRLAVVPCDMGWNDLGTWDSIYQESAKDHCHNSVVGDVLQVDSHQNMLWSEDGLLAVLGVTDLVVIQTKDVTLICPRERAQDIKEMVRIAKASHPALVDNNPVVSRPWGSYVVLDDGDQYKVKRIIVKPGGKLSMQMHYHRSEHWIVVSGTAKITVGETERYLEANESTYISKTERHRLENPGKIPLEIIEIQSGTYLEEDDIVRFDDIYGRTL